MKRTEDKKKAFLVLIPVAVFVVMTFLIAIGLIFNTLFSNKETVSLPNLHLWVKGQNLTEDNLLKKLKVEDKGVIKISKEDFDMDGKDEYVVLHYLGASGGSVSYYRVDDNFAIIEGSCFKWGKSFSYNISAKEVKEGKWEFTFEGDKCWEI